MAVLGRRDAARGGGLQGWWLDAVGGDEGLGIWEVGRDAGGGDGFALFDAGGHGEVEFEELREEVLLGGEAVGGEDGGIECGVGVFERVVAGEFERAIHGPQAAFDFRKRRVANQVGVLREVVNRHSL